MQVQFRADEQALAAGVVVRQMEVDHSKGAKLFKILSDGLYRDKKSSVIREVCSNAFDSHVMAGKRETPFSMHVPTWEEPWFEVRDFGVGLTADEAFATIFSYLGSMKDDSNEFIGGWGLGSKSPYAYSNTFEVVTIKGGRRWEYNCWMDGVGLPQAAVFAEAATDEPNGVTYRVPVRSEDVASFRDACIRYLSRTNFPIEVPNKDDLDGLADRLRPWKLAEFEAAGYKFYISWHDAGQYNVLYGGAVYPTAEIARLKDKLAPVVKMMSSGEFSLLVEARIGDCDFSVSRESMSDTDKTIDWIEASVTALAEALGAAAARYFEERLLPAAKYFKSISKGEAVDLGILDRMSEQNDGRPPLNPVFDFVPYNRYVKAMGVEHVKQAATGQLADIEWGKDLFHFELPLSQPAQFKTAVRRYTHSNVKRIRPLESNYVGRRYVVKRGSKSESAYDKPIRFSLILPATEQVLVLWHNKPVKMSKLQWRGSAAPQIYLAIAEDEGTAKRLMELCGIKGAPTRPLLGHPDFEYEEVARPARGGGGSTELPINVYCASRQQTICEYDPTESYVYDLDASDQAGRMPTGVRKFFLDLGYPTFTASKTFIKRHGNLDNIFHWKSALEELSPDWESGYRHGVTLQAWRDITGGLFEAAEALPQVVWKFITETGDVSKLRSELAPYGMDIRPAIILRHIYVGVVRKLHGKPLSLAPSDAEVLGIAERAREVEAAALRPFRTGLALAAGEYIKLQRTEAYKAVKWDRASVAALPAEKRFALLRFIEQLGV